MRWMLAAWITLTTMGISGCGTARCMTPPIELQGACDAVLGYAWDGAQCTEVSGCACVGEGCGEVFPTRAECREHHDACMAR